MDYQKAKDIREKSFSDMMVKNLIQGGGIGESFSKTISEKTQARVKGFKQAIDPMQIAKTLTFGSNLAPALLGKLTGRSSKDIKFFSGKRRKSKADFSGLDNSVSGVSKDTDGSKKIVEVLGLIYRELDRAEEDRKNDKIEKEREEKTQHKKDEEYEDSRNSELVRALTSRIKPKKSKKSKKGSSEQPRDKKGRFTKVNKETPTTPKVDVAPKVTTPKVETPPKVTTPKVETPPKVTTPKVETPNVFKPNPARTATPTKTTPIIPSGVSKGVGIGAAAAAGAMTITKIIEVGKGYNVVQLASGEIVKREGVWNWRNNNPGNIEYGDYALSNGAIPFDHGKNKPQKQEERFAIFPNYESGRQAKANLIFEGKNYKDLNLDNAIARYAPPKENDTLAYQQSVKKALGFSQDKIESMRMKDFNQDQRNLILSAMEKQEGYGSGKKQTFVIQKGPDSIPLETTGNQIDTSSKENKDLKDSLNKDNSAQIQVNNTQSSSTQSTQQKSEESVDDRPALIRKKRM